jgi:hypothetical protein
MICLSKAFWLTNLFMKGIYGDFESSQENETTLVRVSHGLNVIKDLGESLKEIERELVELEMSTLPTFQQTIMYLNKLRETTINVLFVASKGLFDLEAPNPMKSSRKDDLNNIKDRFAYDTSAQLVIDRPIQEVIEPLLEIIGDMHATLKAKLKSEIELDETEHLLLSSQSIELPFQSKAFGGAIWNREDSTTYRSNLSFLEDYQGMKKTKGMSPEELKCLELMKRVAQCAETVAQLSNNFSITGCSGIIPVHVKPLSSSSSSTQPTQMDQLADGLDHLNLSN